MADKKYLFRCRYSHCLCDTRDITSPKDDVINGAVHYHKKCYECKENIQKIKELYYEKINRAVVMSVLGRTINNIVFDKKVDSNFLLFAVEYAIKNKIKIRSPMALHYLVNNQKCVDAWFASRNNSIKFTFDGNVDETEQKFKYTPKSKRGFDQILKK